MSMNGSRPPSTTPKWNTERRPPSPLSAIGRLIDLTSEREPSEVVSEACGKGREVEEWKKTATEAQNERQDLAIVYVGGLSLILKRCGLRRNMGRGCRRVR